MYPQFFENLVVDTIVKMGYGGSLKDAGRAIGQSGDEGIDGIINEDRLGLDVIYLQAKRWEGNVSRPEIQKFAGALPSGLLLDEGNNIASLLGEEIRSSQEDDAFDPDYEESSDDKAKKGNYNTTTSVSASQSRDTLFSRKRHASQIEPDKSSLKPSLFVKKASSSYNSQIDKETNKKPNLSNSDTTSQKRAKRGGK